MLSAGLITFREGMEAALIVGIVISYLIKVGSPHQVRAAWFGIVVAVAISIAAALTLQIIGTSLEEPYEQIFEGSMMLLAVLILTWMIFWMRYQGRFIKRDLEHKVQTTLASRATLGIFGLAFVAVLREGIETALFLSASAFANDGTATFIGSLVGLTLAVGIGYAIYVMSLRLNLGLFFDMTSVLLLIFAAGLFARGIHEFQEIGWLPILTQSAWNLQTMLPNSSTIGSILRAMVGYNDSPSLLETVGYIFYWAIILLSVRWWTQRLNMRVTAGQAQA
jgi:high-affinity iron transporter